MNIPAVDNGKIRDAGDVLLVEKVLESKKNKGIWPTIELLVDAWSKKTPEDFRGFKVQIDDTRRGLFDRKFGQTKDGKDHQRRLKMIFPEKLFWMIRAIYKPNELPMNTQFYDDFLRRFRFFQIPEKI